MRAEVKMEDVAVRAGVSVGTVSNALNRPHLVSRSTRENVERAIQELNYVRNGAARQLRTGRSTILGMVVWTIANPFFAELANDTESVAERFGLNVLVGSSDHSARREERYLELFELQRPRGLFVIPLGSVPPVLDRLKQSGVPVVLLGDSHPDDYSSVSIDGALGGKLAAQHMTELGRRRLAFVGGPIWQVTDRLSGVSDVVNHTVDATLSIVETPSMTVAEGYVAGQRIARLPEASRPDGIIAANDSIALGVLNALTVEGQLRVPEDIAVIGYDDIDDAASSTVPLSTIRQPRLQIAEEALGILTGLDGGVKESTHTVLRPELIVRGSTVAAR